MSRPSSTQRSTGALAPIPAVRGTAIRTAWFGLKAVLHGMRSVKAPALAVVRSQRWPSLDRVQPKTPAMTAAMNPIVASQAQRPMMRSMFIQPDASALGAAMRRKWRPAPHSRSPPLLARSPSSRNARIGQRFHSRSGLIRLAPRFPIVRNRTACSLFRWHGPHPREPDAPGATRGLPPTCPRMASPA